LANTTFSPLALVQKKKTGPHLEVCGRPTGIADTSAKMQHITELVQQHLPGIYVVALEVTGSKIGSIFTGSDKQVSVVWEGSAFVE
jgi:hypothetical protein